MDLKLFRFMGIKRDLIVNMKTWLLKFQYRKYLILIGVGILTQVSACSFLLPSAKQLTESPWQKFEDVKNSYDQIVPGRTTLVDMQKLGFDPLKSSNIQLLNYLEILERFLPNQSIRIQDLDPAIQTCLKVREQCTGCQISPEVTKNKRYGNLFLDLFNFNRKTQTSGWRFNAIFVAIDDVIMYKLYSGQPNVLRDENKKNPLGPLQDIRVNSPSIDIGGK